MQTPFDGPFKIAAFPTQFPNVADNIGGCCNVPLFIPGQAFLPDAYFWQRQAVVFPSLSPGKQAGLE